LKENWFAFYLSIFKDISVDKALIKMGITKECNYAGIKKMKHSDSEKEYIANLKSQGKTYTELGEMFNMTRSQVAGIVRYYKIKNAARTPTKVVQAAI
jgi:hypothetical protein